MDLNSFLVDFQSDIQTEINSAVDSNDFKKAIPELIFTELVTNHMLDIGMINDPRICHYDAKFGNAIVKLSGYALSDNLDELDLFVTIFSGSDTISNISTTECTRIAGQCVRFFQLCIDGKLFGAIDPSHEVYDLVFTIQEKYSELSQIRIFVLTDRKSKEKMFKDRIIEGKTVKLQVMDIERLYNHLQEGRPRDELVIDVKAMAGDALPCVWVPSNNGEYDYALSVIPGEVLRHLYDKYGQRILEANVRSFLQQNGKVNKGIRDTLRDQPERFMAYNNGIVVIVDELEVGRTSAGGPGILWMKGVQIVNGGQTTASMYFTKKKYPKTDLSNVMVPAKVLVMKSLDSVGEESLVSDISRYANSQNVVRQSDLSSNQPFHIELEKCASAVVCPDGVGRWFYERSTGSYRVYLDREGKTTAGIKRLKNIIPTSRKLIKTDLAKFECAWGMRPDLVSLGGQKAFQAYMNLLSSNGHKSIALPDRNEFKNIIARAILFKSIYKTIRREFPAYQAFICSYTVSITSKIIGENISLLLIWNNQSISEELHDQMFKWSQEVSNVLYESSNGRMISEWSKKPECWDIVKGSKFSCCRNDIPEFFL